MKKNHEWLSHPLLILIVGAIISSLLLPWFTKGWQDHQKELEIKTDLVKQMGQSVNDMILSLEFKEVGAITSQQDANKGLEDWMKSSGSITSTLKVYFPETQIAAQWDNYSKMLYYFDIFVYQSDKSTRQEQLQNVRHYSSPVFENVDWNILVDRNSPQYWKIWQELKQQFLNQKDVIMRSVIDTNIRL